MIAPTCECGNAATKIATPGKVDRFFCFRCRAYVGQAKVPPSPIVENPVTTSTGARFDFKPTDEGVCKCGQPYAYGEATFVGRESSPCLIHMEPHCQTFIDLDPADFLAWVKS